MGVLTPAYQLPDLRPFRSIEHRLRLAGGAVVTENGVLRSDDYVPGLSGWCIFGDGTAEFNDGTFRGEIDASGLNIRINATDDGAIEFFSLDGSLVGRLTADSWEIGDLDTPGQRATLDPVGGLRFRSADDALMSLVDQQGISIRDEATGTVVAELNRDSVRLVDPAGEDEIMLSTSSDDLLAKPRYTGAVEVAPGSSHVIPAATLLSANDIEIGHVASFKRGTVQAATHAPPAGWTEQLDNDYGLASTLACSVVSRSLATGTAGTVISTQSNWDEAVGTHVIVRGVLGGTAPSVRSVAQLEDTETSTLAELTIPTPAGATVGDVLIVFIAMGNAGGSVPLGWTTPEGWVFLGAQVTLTGSGSTMSTLAVGTWAKLITASDPATYGTTINFGPGVKTIHGSLVCIQDAAVVAGGAQFNIGGYNLAGAWLPWTPTYTGITTIGNATIEAYYLVMGKTCFFSWSFVVGSTTVLSAASMTVSLPIPATGISRMSVNSIAVQSGGRRWPGQGFILVSNPNFVRLCHITSGNNGEVSGAHPFTVGTGDVYTVGGTYQIA